MALLLSTSPLHAADQAFDWHAQPGPIDIQAFIQILSNTTLPDEWIINGNADAEFQNNPSPRINLGFTESRTFWFKVRIISRNQASLTPAMLEISAPQLDYLEAFVHPAGKAIYHYQTGDTYPFHQRPVKARNFVIPLEAHSGIIDVYFKVRANNLLIFPLSIATRDDYHFNESIHNTVDGIIYGVLLGITLFNLFIFFATRELAYLFYVATGVCGFLVSAATEGYSFMLFWPQHPGWWQQNNVFLLETAVIAFGMPFVKYFLNIPWRSKLGYLFIALQAFAVIIWIGYPLITTGMLANIAVIHLSIGLLVMMLAGYYRHAQGFGPGKYLYLSFVFIFILVVIGTAAIRYNSFDYTVFTYMIKVAISAQFLLVSMALGSRIR
jgi:hypothetical protein